jgi:hypothetical protein
VTPLTISPTAPEVPPEAGVDLHLVKPGRREKADPRQQRLALQARCLEIARWLARTGRFEDRVELYRMGVFTRQELATAAALYPDLMPTLNGEWEWIAITVVDSEDAAS